MLVTKLGTIAPGQDGAIWKTELFRLDAKGICHVYDLRGETPQPMGTFTLGSADKLCPHSNAVMFGSAYYQPGDAYPLLYSNIYNNCAGKEDPMEGTCCVYRLQRNDGVFSAQLVQLIRVEFTATPLWSSVDCKDVRPYGNFVVDRERNILYAYTMRDENMVTRYFAFPLPGVTEGQMDPEFGVRCVTLQQSQMLDTFDCPYHRFLQGGCVHNGKIYSVEGFTCEGENPPALRLIDPLEKKQLLYLRFGDHGLTVEPELIDFCGEDCYYSDGHGNLYIIALEEMDFV